MSLPYRTRIQELSIPTPSGDAALRLETLVDLDQTIDELFEILTREGRPEVLEELCPYFGVIWPAAQALTHRICAELSRMDADQRRYQKVLEIGCGLALPSIAAARWGAEVLATDSHPEVESFLSRNLALNPLLRANERVPKYIRSDWTSESMATPGLPSLGKYQWVIGSDILYERAFIPKVARWIDHHLLPGGHAIITDPGRPYLQTFADEMRSRGLYSETSAEGDVFVLKFKKPTA